MLDELLVRNLGVIGEARLEPGHGMVVVTGETGAGKTLLLGALRMLLGGTARTEQIGPEGAEASVEGRFLVDDVELVVARRLTEGRSRAYLDGHMVSARALADRLESSIEIVGQHDQISLTKPQEARRLVDRLLPSRDLFDAYRSAWDRVTELRHAQEKLGGDRRALERERDLAAYQVEEIAGAGLEPGADLALERRAARLANADRIVELAATAHAGLESSQGGTGDAVAAARQLLDLDPSQTNLLDLIESIEAQLAEAVSMARGAADGAEHDPAALEEVERQLTGLGDLKRKYGADLTEILRFRDQAAARHEEVSSLLEQAATLDADLAESEQALAIAGAALRSARETAAVALSKAAIGHMRELGFSDPVLDVTVGEAAPGPDGADRVEIQFASDSRLAAGPVAKVASGGELSRLVLSLRLASGAGAARVVAFDEIDSGVGGTTALAMGTKLAALAADRQVLCVTHLPQVAAHAARHYVVERDGAESRVRLVDGEERLEELSRMLSGLPDSTRGRQHAEELRAIAMQSGVGG